MTQQDGALLTRRALRTQAADATPAPSTSPSPSPSAGTPPEPPARALTRRELRLAAIDLTVDPGTTGQDPHPDEAARALPTGSAGPTVAAVPTTPTVADRPLTRRELRLRERALTLGDDLGDDLVARSTAAEVAGACRPPFIASLVLPVHVPDVLGTTADAPEVAASTTGAGTASMTTATRAAARPTTTRPGAPSRGPGEARPGRHPVAGTAVGARPLLAHLGRRPVAVVALSAGLLTAGVTQVHAEQTTVQTALSQAAAAAAEVQRQERVDGATSGRLLAQAAAYAAAQRTQALTAAETAVAAAQGAREVAAPVLDAETVAALETAAAELAAMLEAAPAPPLAVAGPQDDTSTVDDRVDQASRSISPEGRDPLPETATQNGTQNGTESGTATDGAAPVDAATPEQARTAGGAGSTATGAADAPTQQESPSAQLVEALPDLDIEVSLRIQEQAAEVAALTAQVQGLADAKIAEAAAAAAAAEAERLAAEAAAQAAAAERARKIAVATDAPNGEIPTDVLCGVGFDEGVLLRCDAAAALEELNAAYRADFGRDLNVVSSYRSYSAQVAVRRTRGSLAAPPGMSNHGYGVAVDFDGFGGLGNFSTANYRWMRANAEQFGWYHPRVMRPGGGGPQEPWHWEFGTDS